MNEPKKTYVKILFYTKSEDGYPSEEWEAIWARTLSTNTAVIDNIPFYAKGISCDDIVEYESRGTEYHFVSVVEPSGNSTLRVVIFELGMEGEIRRDLLSLGCLMEGTGTPGMLAVNVPQGKLDEVQSYLEGCLAADRIDYESGALR